MQATNVPRAVVAATSTVTVLDLRVDNAVVLRDTNRLVLRLMPCDVVARVAPMAFQASAELEVELAQRLAESESPVVALDPRFEPTRHVRDGSVIEYVDLPATRDTSTDPTSRLRPRARAPACRYAASRSSDSTFHRSSRGSSTRGREPRRISGTR